MRNMNIAELTENLDQSESDYLTEECAAFEHLLGAALQSLTKIQAIDKQWQDALRANNVQFNFAFDRELTQRYRNWVAGARVCLQQLELQEAKECHPASADEFRQRLDSAEEMLLERTQDEAAALANLQDMD
jgi:hypothetical protein